MKLNEINSYDKLHQYCCIRNDNIAPYYRSNPSGSLNIIPIDDIVCAVLIRSYNTPIGFVDSDGKIWVLHPLLKPYKSITTGKILTVLSRNNNFITLEYLNKMCDRLKIKKGWNE